jgi:hypothetical protein
MALFGMQASLFGLTLLVLAACTAITPLVTPSATPPAAEAPASTHASSEDNGLISLPSPTPMPLQTPQPQGVGVAPAPAPVGTVVYYEGSIDIPTYPYENYLVNEIDTTLNWPYRRFELERFEQERPQPVLRTYRLIVLENAYIKMLIMPELGGRIVQVFHKPSGNSMFYRNFVIKPSRWGPGNQLGWIAAGGLEWNVPVVEHGYDWGTKWGILPLQHSEDLATVNVFTPSDGRSLNVSITIKLQSGAAAFEIEPAITNLTNREISFDYWHSAALAPGPGNEISSELRFVFPSAQMTVHSTQDPVFPAPGEQVSWPYLPDGRDLSRLGTWQQFAGFFEYPAAHGPFVGVYDASVDDGSVRVFPAEVARGSKLFALGWGDALDSGNYTDDGSRYVEVHGGLAPTFDQHATLSPGAEVSWREVWYPVHGIGGLSTANEVGALHVRRGDQGLFVGFYPTRPITGNLVAFSQGNLILRKPVEVRPDLPHQDWLVSGALPEAALEVHVEDSAGNSLLQYILE